MGWNMLFMMSKITNHRHRVLELSLIERLHLRHQKLKIHN